MHIILSLLLPKDQYERLYWSEVFPFLSAAISCACGPLQHQLVSVEKNKIKKLSSVPKILLPGVQTSPDNKYAQNSTGVSKWQSQGRGSTSPKH